MTYLEVRALFTTRDSTPRPIPSDSVYLLLGSDRRRARRFPLENIGLVGRADACLWSDLNALVDGAVTITFESGDGFELSRSQERGPLAITFQRNPNRTCLLFAIPLRTAEVVRLHFAGYETTVTLPS